MKKLAFIVGVIVLLLGLLIPSTVAAGPAVIHVPEDCATIQEAVDAASPGDTIKVGPGEYAGAVIDKELTLMGSGADTVIKNLEGCPLYRGRDYLPVGFWLEEGAEGTTISHFTFDGAGVSDVLPEVPSGLAFAVFSVAVDDVSIQHNTILGTIQGISNWYGSNWVISHNKIVDQEYWHGGGLSIVVGSEMCDTDPRIASGNTVAFNQITGTVAADFDGSYSMGGVTLFGAQDTLIRGNRVVFVNNSETEDLAIAICVTSFATLEREWPWCEDTRVVNNDCRDSEICLWVDEGNADGLFTRGNFGRNVIPDLDVDTEVSNRSPATIFVDE